MCYAPSVQWGKPSWFQSEVHSHWSTSSRMAFWDMCLVSSLPRHWAGIVSFRVSRRALELERERQHSRPGSRPRKVARRQGNKRRPTSAAVVTCVVQRYLATYIVQQSLVTYNDVVTDNVQLYNSIWSANVRSTPQWKTALCMLEKAPVEPSHMEN